MQLAADAKRPLILGIWEEAISLWSAGGGDEEDSNEKVGMLPLYIMVPARLEVGWSVEMMSTCSDHNGVQGARGSDGVLRR